MEIKNLFFLQKAKTILILCIVFVLFSAAEIKSQQTNPEIEEIIKTVSVDSQKGAIFDYTYLMKVSYNRHKFGGRKFTRLYEAILPTRYSLDRDFTHPLILIQDTEKFISPDEIMNTRKNIAKQLEMLESEEEKKAAENKEIKDSGGYWTMGFSANEQKIRIDVMQLLKNSRWNNIQRNQVDGRNVALLEFIPNPSATFDKTLSYLSKLEGQIWIDETDKRVVRIEGYAPGVFAGLKDKTDSERQKEAIFLFLQTKVIEGFWFPQIVRLNFAKHPEVFEPIELEFTFTNYKKSSVDVLFKEEAGKDTNPPTQEKPK